MAEKCPFDTNGDGDCQYCFRIGGCEKIGGPFGPVEGIEPEYLGDIRQASAGCWHETNSRPNSTCFGPDHCRKPCVSGTRYCEEHQGSKRR
jgi:hypothetical protein